MQSGSLSARRASLPSTASSSPSSSSDGSPPPLNPVPIPKMRVVTNHKGKKTYPCPECEKVANCFLCYFTVKYISEPANWSSGNAFVSVVGGLRFKSRAGHIGRSVANGSPPPRHFFIWSCVTRRRNDAQMGPANSLHASA